MNFICIFHSFILKIQNSCILTCILHMDLRRYLHWIAWMRVVFRLSYRKDRIGIQKEIYIYASHVAAYPIFNLTKIALSIVVMVCIFISLLSHNVISCTTISL